MTGGWGPRKRSVLAAIAEVADAHRTRYREGTNDPERPPVGPASGTLANPRRVQVEVVLPPLDFTCTGCKCPHHEETTDDR